MDANNGIIFTWKFWQQIKQNNNLGDNDDTLNDITMLVTK